MSKAIEKYIYAVTRRCPEGKRDEIKKELESNIYDMLSDKPTDSEIDTVLHQLGNPIYVAAKYQDEEKYVVSPMFYQDYLLVLKWTMIGFGCLAAMVSIIQAFTINSSIIDIWELVGVTITTTIENLTSFLLSGFAIVTLIFWSLNHPKAKDKVKTWLNNWKTSELMDVPETKREEKHQGRWTIFFEMFFTLLFSTFFTVAFIGYQDLIGIYVNGTRVAPIFGVGFMDTFKWFLIIGLALTFFYYVYYVKVGKKSLSVLIFYTLNTIYSIIITIFFLSHPDFLSPLFIAEVANIFTTSADNILHYVDIAIKVIIAMILTVSTFDLAYQWYKYMFKKNKANA